MSAARIHGRDAATAGDLGTVDDVAGTVPELRGRAALRSREASTDRPPRARAAHPTPFCTYYGDTDPKTIERDVQRAKEIS